jgi:hypothetical protein
METRTPFWPLWRHGLGIGWLEPVHLLASLGCFLAFWFFLTLAPLLVILDGGPSFRGNVEVFFASVFPLMAFFWFLFVVLILSLMSDSIWNVSGSEFLFTRAINRGRLFRAKATAVFLLITLPMFLNLLLSPWMRELTVDVDSRFGAVVAHEEVYAKAFPRNNAAAVSSSLTSNKVVIRNGTVTLAGWLLWWGVSGFLVAQSYCALIARRFGQTGWHRVALPYLPILVLLIWVFVPPRLPVNLYEESFLLFSRHPVLMAIALVPLAIVVESFCERRFSRLEIL